MASLVSVGEMTGQCKRHFRLAHTDFDLVKADVEKERRPDQLLIIFGRRFFFILSAVSYLENSVGNIRLDKARLGILFSHPLERMDRRANDRVICGKIKGVRRVAGVFDFDAGRPEFKRDLLNGKPRHVLQNVHRIVENIVKPGGAQSDKEQNKKKEFFHLQKIMLTF